VFSNGKLAVVGVVMAKTQSCDAGMSLLMCNVAATRDSFFFSSFRNRPMSQN